MRRRFATLAFCLIILLNACGAYIPEAFAAEDVTTVYTFGKSVSYRDLAKEAAQRKKKKKRVSDRDREQAEKAAIKRAARYGGS